MRLWLVKEYARAVRASWRAEAGNHIRMAMAAATRPLWLALTDDERDVAERLILRMHGRAMGVPGKQRP